MVLVADRESSVLNLAELRRELRYKLHEMAKELSKFLGYELPVDRYKNYEYGAVKRIPGDVLNAAARLQAEQVRRDSPKPGYIVTVALQAYRGVMGGSSIDEESYYEREDFQEIPAAFLIGGLDKIDQHEVVRVSGNSMAPRIFSGERIVIFKDSLPRQSTIVFVESPAGQLFLKCLRVRDARFVLESYADGAMQVEDMHGWRIHGYAIAILGDPDHGQRNIEWNDGRPLKA